MTVSASDSAQVVRSRDAAMHAFGHEKAELEYATIPAVKVINERSKYNISIAVVPAWWRPLLRRLPWYNSKGDATEAISNLAVTAVIRRLKASSVKEENILSKLIEATDEDGNHMGKMELSAEAMTLLVAGTDTTSK